MKTLTAKQIIAAANGKGFAWAEMVLEDYRSQKGDCRSYRAAKAALEAWLRAEVEE